MPSYIELLKNDSLPPASGADKVVFGVNENSEVVFINNSGETLNISVDIIDIQNQITGLTEDVSDLYLMITGASYSEVTYSELVNNITGSTLTPGSFYLITDFRTCYDQPDYDYNGNSITVGNYKQSEIDPIVVLATSTNTISTTAYQPSYPYDKIKYDWTFNQTEITQGVAYGRISERIDVFNNRTDYDHRTILFKRYKSYFYELNNPLQGRIDINENEVTGYDTNFVDDLSPQDVIYILEYDKFFMVDSISSETGMTISGNTLITANNLTYYYADSYRDGSNITIPYTHTRMTDPPITWEEPAPISGFTMDGSIVSGTSYFGTGSTYFTNLYPGLFVLVAHDININTFEINGNSGADGDGLVDFNIYSTTGTTGYTAYIKRSYDNDDPSTNQIIIVNNDGSGIQYNYSLNSNSNLQKLYNLSGTTQIHYLVTSTIVGVELTIETIQTVIESYLSYVDSESLSNTLSNLNSSYTAITDNITDLFLFNDVEDVPNSQGGVIDDGGYDMYDGGNSITTDLLQKTLPFRCYEIKNNNIPDDNFFYRELKTFQCDKEIEDDDYPTSINNFIGNHSDFYFTNLSHSAFMLSNNVFDKYSYSNTIGDRSYNNSTYRWFSRNTISNRFYNNKIYRGFYSNVIGEYFNNNNFSGSFYRNNIGEEFSDNNVGNTFDKNFIRNSFTGNVILGQFIANSIANDFEGNRIYSDFEENTISENYSDNIIGDVNNISSSSFDKNTIRPDFYENIIYGDFYKNDIGINFNTNEISGSTNFNYIGIRFENNTIYNDFNYNKIGDEFKGNMTFQSFSTNFVQSYVSGNHFSGNTYENNIGSYTLDNDFSGYLSQNTWGPWFTQNSIGANFEYNQIGNQFYSNTIGENFKQNQIGNYFHNNNINDNFGFGGSQAQGNKIGNEFNNNEIGEYFYNNVIPDNFGNNTVGNYFKWNVVNTVIDSVDFNVNYGNVTGISWTTSATGLTDSTYTNLNGTITGNGSNATYNVIVSGGVVTDILINQTGRLYEIGTQTTLDGNYHGGISGVDDIIVTITGISQTPSVYDTYTCNIFERQGGDKRLSFYDSSDILTITDINV